MQYKEPTKITKPKTQIDMNLSPRRHTNPQQLNPDYTKKQENLQRALQDIENLKAEPLDHHLQPERERHHSDFEDIYERIKKKQDSFADFEKRRNPFYLNQFRYTCLHGKHKEEKGFVMQITNTCKHIKEPLLANWPKGSDNDDAY